MEAIKTINEQLASARQLEGAGQLPAAAAIYQKIFDKDANNQEVMGRLLVMYRKLKDYRKELAVLDAAIGAYKSGRKAASAKWIQSHPAAARAGKSMLKQLEKGGDNVIGLGVPPVIERWFKRRDFVENRIKGKKTAKPGKLKNGGGKEGGRANAARVKGAEETRAKKAEEARVKKAEETRARKAGEVRVKKAEEAWKKKEASAIRKDKAEEMRARKEETRAKKAEEARVKKVEEGEEVRARKADAERAKETEAMRHPSLFVIILRYLVSLEKIDAMMKQHMIFLDKHYANGDFLVSGRQVPRTGGIIIARAKDRNTVERIVKQDPFVRKRLASADIIEFSASQHGKDFSLL